MNWFLNYRHNNKNKRLFVFSRINTHPNKDRSLKRLKTHKNKLILFIMKIENVNEGICQWRATNNKPCFFVNWTQDGENKYQFFSIISSRETFKQILLKLQNN